MKVMQCDRCGKTFKENGQQFARYDKKFDLYYKGGQSDLCDKCRASFLEWFAHPEPEDNPKLSFTW